MTLPAPLAHELNDKGRLEVSPQAKAFVGAMGLSLEQAARWPRPVVRRGQSGAVARRERAGQVDTWKRQAHQVFGDRLEGMAATIDRYLAAIAPDNALVAEWGQHGVSPIPR